MKLKRRVGNENRVIVVNLINSKRKKSKKIRFPFKQIFSENHELIPSK